MSRVSSRFEAVDREIEILQSEMRAMAARMRQLEAVATSPTNTTKTVHTTMSTVSSSSLNAGLQRIMNRPMSPTYVGPTSAEFGISAGQKASDDSDADDFVSTAAASPAAPRDTEPIAGDPLGCLDMEEALRLVTVYENTVGIMYPCVDLDSVRTYVKDYFRSGRQRGPMSPATADQDWFFARNVEVLKIILATALLAESHGQSERAALLADSVEDRFGERMKIPEVDMKELLCLTLLVNDFRGQSLGKDCLTNTPVHLSFLSRRRSDCLASYRTGCPWGHAVGSSLPGDLAPHRRCLSRGIAVDLGDEALLVYIRP